MATSISGTTGIDKVQDGSIGQDDLAANVAGTGPVFSAYQSTPQGLTTALAKVNYQTEVYDTSNCFASSRFTPTVAGFYQITGSVATTPNQALIAVICKNGAEALRGPFLGSGTVSVATGIVYLNGTTDYVEVWAYCGATQNSVVGQSYTYFQGYLARAA